MRILSALLGGGFILVVLWDAFETIILPRRVTRRVRLTRLFYRYTWVAYSALVSSLWFGKRKEGYFSFYGPLSLLVLVGLWALGLMVGFACLHWAAGSELNTPDGRQSFLTDLYLSGTTFFTLGLGDVSPRTALARFLVVMEAGMGFAFLALIIGYVPPLNQSFSRREVSISLLDARAGSPPTAAEMLFRHKDTHGMEELEQLLHEWELWSAEFLEIHLSYPVLAYFRSQHDNQSWLAALTTVLDASALVMTGVEGACRRQAQRTFAMARHAVVDLAIVFYTPPLEPERDRLSPAELAHLRSTLAASGLKLREGSDADGQLKELRGMYEPYIYSLSQYFRISVPPWIRATSHPDNWQMSVWEPPSRPFRKRGGGHF
ncbi:MAG: two pore domain potassium channel family protein [Desulfomonile tiedjei]|nr:two pore domain potassium channel family protein [Desulfomonile tiedjei]